MKKLLVAAETGVVGKRRTFYFVLDEDPVEDPAENG